MRDLTEEILNEFKKIIDDKFTDYISSTHIVSELLHHMRITAMKRSRNMLEAAEFLGINRTTLQQACAHTVPTSERPNILATELNVRDTLPPTRRVVRDTSKMGDKIAATKSKKRKKRISDLFPY
jgi:DNA-binding phage protein